MNDPAVIANLRYLAEREADPLGFLIAIIMGVEHDLGSRVSAGYVRARPVTDAKPLALDTERPL